MANHSGVDQPAQRIEHVFEWNSRVEDMELEDVHVVRLEAPQTASNAVGDVRRIKPAGPTSVLPRQADLGRHDEPVPAAPQQTSEVLLRRSLTVEVGGIEEGDALRFAFVEDPR